MRKTLVLAFVVLLFLVVSLLFWNNLSFLTSGDHPLDESLSNSELAVKNFEPEHFLYSNDGSRYAFSYFTDEAPRSLKQWLAASIPTAMPGLPPVTPDEGYLVLDGELFFSEDSRSSGEWALSERSGTFGFLNDNTFWYLLNDNFLPQLHMEGIDVPEHEYAYVYERAGVTFFVLLDNADRIYFREGREVNEREIITEGLTFLTKMTYEKKERGSSLSYGYFFSPRDVYTATNGDILLGRGLLSSTDRLFDRFEKVDKAISSQVNIWFHIIDSSKRYIYKNDEIFRTHDNDGRGLGGSIMIHDVIGSGPVYWLATDSGPSTLFFGESEIAIPEGQWVSRVINSKKGPVILLHDGSTDGLYSVMYGEKIIASNEDIYPESAVLVNGSILKFAAFEGGNLREVEVQLEN